MPTREQALSLLRTLEDDYEKVGARLGIPAGQAYLVATGLPADGGDAYGSEELHRPGAVQTSTQALVNHAEPENPTTKPHVHEWIARRTRADRQMQAAAAGRDAAPGEVLEAEEADICTVLTRDHDQVTALLRQLKTIPGVTDGGSPVHLSRRTSIVDMIAVALSQHEATEQEHFWPAVRSDFDDGELFARQALQQEQEGKDLLRRLGQLEASDEDFDRLAVELDKAARKHVAFEDVVLLALRRDMPLDARRQLGEKFRRAEGRAPTRPHPRSPTAPAAAVKAAGAAAGAMDAARDEVGHRPAERRGKASAEAKQQTRQAKGEGADR